MTLASLQRGRKYVIDDVNATDPDVQRLMVLGLEYSWGGNAV